MMQQDSESRRIFSLTFPWSDRWRWRTRASRCDAALRSAVVSSPAGSICLLLNTNRRVSPCGQTPALIFTHLKHLAAAAAGALSAPRTLTCGVRARTWDPHVDQCVCVNVRAEKKTTTASSVNVNVNSVRITTLL